MPHNYGDNLYSNYSAASLNTLLKLSKGPGVFFHPTLKKVNSIIYAEILR